MSARWVHHTGRSDGDLVNVVVDEDGAEVGLVWNEEAATLASAAPELLAACMSALRALEDNLQPGPMDGDAKEGLRAAIARATGGGAL